MIQLLETKDHYMRVSHVPSNMLCLAIFDLEELKEVLSPHFDTGLLYKSVGKSLALASLRSKLLVSV